jgi:hypothetical protein
VAMGRHIPPLARVGGVLRRIAQRPADVSTVSPVGVCSASAARRSGPGPIDGFHAGTFPKFGSSGAPDRPPPVNGHRGRTSPIGSGAAWTTGGARDHWS